MLWCCNLEVSSSPSCQSAKTAAGHVIISTTLSPNQPSFSEQSSGIILKWPDVNCFQRHVQWPSTLLVVNLAKNSHENHWNVENEIEINKNQVQSDTQCKNWQNCSFMTWQHDCSFMLIYIDLPTTVQILRFLSAPTHQLRMQWWQARNHVRRILVAEQGGILHPGASLPGWTGNSNLNWQVIHQNISKNITIISQVVENGAANTNLGISNGIRNRIWVPMRSRRHCLEDDNDHKRDPHREGPQPPEFSGQLFYKVNPKKGLNLFGHRQTVILNGC